MPPPEPGSTRPRKSESSDEVCFVPKLLPLTEIIFFLRIQQPHRGSQERRLITVAKNNDSESDWDTVDYRYISQSKPAKWGRH